MSTSFQTLVTSGSGVGCPLKHPSEKTFENVISFPSSEAFEFVHLNGYNIHHPSDSLNMDLNQINLEPNLIPMLEALSKAHFVSFDLELSGIAYSKTSKRRTQENRASRKQTLQERYEDVKDAAEKYQVLQIGFTITKEDTEQNSYYMRPYNMFLSPLIKDDQIDIQRDFTFQNFATNFLLGKGFNIEGPFKEGVPYLSMDEEKEALLSEDWKANKDNIASLIPTIHDPVMKAFIANIRRSIEQWQAEQSDRALIIAPGTQVAGGTVPAKLTGFQRRIVHELVRTEYPGLSTGSSGVFVSVFPRDEGRESAERASREELFKRRLQKQKGISWFVEGLARGLLEPANPANWASMEDGKPVWVEPEKIKAQFKGLRWTLQRKKTVLVGHNVFVDLVYFYKTFIGRLPDKVEHFAAIIHSIFPRVVDTKYIAAYGEEDVPINTGLEHVYENYGLLPFPLIEVDPAHDKYNNSQCAHEAGWDAYATACVLVRLSAIIARTATASVPAAGPELSLVLRPRPSPPPPHPLDEYTPSELPISPLRSWATRDTVQRWLGPALNPASTPGPAAQSPAMQVSPPSVRPQSSASCQFASPDDLIGLSPLQSPRSPAPVSSLGVAESAGPAVESDNELFMPSFSSDMWEVYGNKLLINGTLEGELYLGRWGDGAL